MVSNSALSICVNTLVMELVLCCKGSRGFLGVYVETSGEVGRKKSPLVVRRKTVTSIKRINY